MSVSVTSHRWCCRVIVMFRALLLYSLLVVVGFVYAFIWYIAALARDKTAIEVRHIHSRMQKHVRKPLFLPTLSPSQSFRIYFRFWHAAHYFSATAAPNQPHLVPSQHIFSLFVISHQRLFNKHRGNSSPWLCRNLIKWLLFSLQASQTYCAYSAFSSYNSSVRLLRRFTLDYPFSCLTAPTLVHKGTYATICGSEYNLWAWHP